jgi:hypothetical protein
MGYIMKSLSVTRFLRWFQTQAASFKGRGSRRLRRRSMNPFSTIAAEVEQLESRQLLSVTFHGGAVLSAVETQAVYLGTDWQNNASLRTQAGQLDQFVKTIVNSPYMDGLTQAGYGVGRGTSSGGVLVNVGINKSVYLTDAQIQGDLQSLIQHGQVQPPDANRLYIVYVEPGVAIQDGSSTSVKDFDGYHSSFVGKTASGLATDIRYAVIAYPGSPNVSIAAQGFSSNFAQMTSVTSHELAEAATNPDAFTKSSGGKLVGGWWDDAYLQANKPPEIGDITLNSRTTLDGYTVQEVSNRNDQPIDPNNLGQVQTLIAPNASASAVSSTVARVSWNSVSSAQGYRVYEWNGSQRVLLGTFSASTTNIQVTGLGAATTNYFQVEVFNSTQVADSAWASVTTPSAQSLSTPLVSATALSSSSVLVTWNSQPAEQGYRVYWWNGSQAVLLSTVGSSTTSITISSLNPGSTSYFLIEAYNSSQIANSAWVAAVTPFAPVRAVDVTSMPGSAGNSVPPSTPALSLLDTRRGRF